MSENLEITIYQYSRQGRKIEYSSLQNERSHFDPEDYNAEFFWGATGGISIKVENYKVILDCDEFYVALRAIDFLLQSLAWIYETELNWLDLDVKHPDDVAIRFQSGNILRLAKFDQKSLALSYVPQGLQYTNQRGDSFFRNHHISKEAWASATKIALSEYFDVIDHVTCMDHGDQSSQILSDYSEAWKKLNNQ